MPLESAKQKLQVLSDEQILQLVAFGQRIEAHFGCPQDIEWCLVKDQFYIVQSRPITTLFPPPVSKDGGTRVYMSVGHMQVMTDPILPLGMSVFELASLFPLDSSGGRLYVDITHDLTTSAGQRMVMRKADNMDPLMASSVRKLLAHKDYLKQLPRGKANLTTGVNWFPWLIEALNMYWRNDPAILDERIKKHKDDY